MVDEGRVTRLLRGLDERISRLQLAIGTSSADRTDFWLDAVKYQLITAIECCVDVGHHFASSEGWGAIDSNAEALRQLGNHEVIDVDLARSLAQAVGFRNVLVHRYVDVDDDLVESALERVDEFERFVAQVGGWLLDSGNEPRG